MRTLIIRLVLIPGLIIATAFLAWWTWRTTRMLERVEGRSHIDSTLLLTREKVDRVEQSIIADDNAVAHFVNPDDLDALAARWPEVAAKLSPTTRGVMVLDQSGRVLRAISRAGPESAQRFRAMFTEHLAGEIKLDDEEPNGHKHLHTNVDGESVLVSYLTREVGGRRYFVVLDVDLDYVVNKMFTDLLAESGQRQRFSVVDENGRVVFGASLQGPADYIVSRPFPTTLYKWRVSAATQDVPELQRLAHRKQLLDTVFVLLSLGVLLAAFLFMSYAAQSEKKLNHMKSDFIATVSHELKTPLSLIRMFGEMLATDKVQNEAKKKQYLDIIVRESERLTALIENVLDFAKVERGKAAYEFAPTQLDELAARSVELFRSRLDRDRPLVVLELGADVPAADLDERAMQLLILNLLDNAVKYAGGSERIVVAVHAEAGGRKLVMEVRDQGPGIDADDARRIFERFYRGKSAQRGNARGSGIGLALVQHIAQAHGGDVMVHSRPGEGATFRVEIPVRKRRAEENNEEAHAGA